MKTPEQQLREAFDLIQNGKKAEAAEIAKDVLETNRNNVKAWWLLANILEDDERVITCLEQILKIQPDHNGATRMLAQLRDTSTNVIQAEIFTESPASKPLSSKPLPGDVPSVRKNAASRSGDSLAMGYVYASAGIMIIVLVIILIAQFFGGRGSQATPTETVETYLTALADENYRTIQTVMCDDRRDDVDALRTTINNTTGLSDADFNFASVGFEQLSQTESEASLRVFGDVVIRVNGTETVLDFEGFTALLDTAISPVVMLTQQNSEWYIC